MGVVPHAFSDLLRDTSTGGTHSGGPTCSLPGKEQPLLCLMYALFLTGRTLTDPKIDFFHFVLVVLKNKNRFYSIYEKRDVLRSGQ